MFMWVFRITWLFALDTIPILLAYQERHRNTYLIFNSVRYPDLRECSNLY